ncbi:hypothetical protein [Paenibacillus sp. S150]|uniref:hypothetical protein n=1 Tax=Paenibacillus sp. S150 TaxID=2749826 RepID=UPI001C577722|nr:hypothetical protein [Paenibacillus sp. S150]MBW4083717.1 hypothetical protein [Paenibacillus sp. S150]
MKRMNRFIGWLAERQWAEKLKLKEWSLRKSRYLSPGVYSNHWFIPLPPGTAGEELQLDIELYDPVPEPEDPLNRQAVIKPPLDGIEITLVRVNPPVYSLLHTVKTAHEAALLLPADDMRRIRTAQALERAMDTLYEGASAGSVFRAGM